MLAIYGFALLGATFLLLGYGTTILRQPRPPRWAGRFMVIESFCVLLTAMVSSGIALLLRFSLQFDGIWMSVAGAGSLIGAIILFAVIWRMLGVSRKLAAYPEGPAASAMAASAANKGGPGDPASSGTHRDGTGGRRKRAA